MRSSILFLGLLFFVTASAQQITNVTYTPNPLHACVPVTFHITGTSAPQFEVTNTQTSIGESSITLVFTVTPGPGSVQFNHTVALPALAEGQYNLSFSLKRNNNVTSTWTGVLNVLPAQMPDMGQPNSITICPNDPAFSLLTQLGGTPSSGGLWIDPVLNNVPNGIFQPGVNIDGDYVYYFDMPAPCGMQVQMLSVTTLPNNSAGRDTTLAVCTMPGSPEVDLFSALAGTPLSGGTWTSPGGGNAGTFIPGSSSFGQYVYQVTGIPPCSDPTATITVVDAPLPNAGTGGAAIYCFDETGADLATHVTGGATNGVWYEPSGYAIAYYNDPVDVSTYGAGVYKYVVENGPCPGDTAYVTVTLDGPPCTIGIAEIQAPTGSMVMVPNPAHGQFTLEVKLLQAVQGLTLVITDIEGRSVMQRSMPAVRSFRETVDITGLSPGVYSVELRGGARLPVQRLVVQ